MARTEKTALKKSCEGGHPCLHPGLRGNAFSFSPLRMAFAVALSYMTHVETCAFYTHCLETCFKNHKWVLNFVKSFFQHMR